MKFEVVFNHHIIKNVKEIIIEQKRNPPTIVNKDNYIITLETNEDVRLNKKICSELYMRKITDKILNKRKNILFDKTQYIRKTKKHLIFESYYSEELKGFGEITERVEVE